MNKKLIKVITPVALMAVVGTGFSAWVFNKTATQSTNGLTITIGAATEGGTIRISNANKAKFEINQGTTIAKNTKGSGGLCDDGLSFTYDSLSADYYNSGNGRTDDNEESDKQSITRTYAVELDSALSKYFTIVQGKTGKWEDEVDLASGDENTGTALIIDWVEGMKPLNMTQYKTMTSALANATITVTFTATVVDAK